MALLAFDRNPPARLVRQFGLVWFPLFFGLVGALAYRRTGAWTSAMEVWVPAAVVTLAGAAYPPLMRAIWIGWMAATFPIAWVVSHLVVGMAYYLVIVPFGLVLRLRGRDLLDRRIDRGASTYWRAHDPAGARARYFRQF
jgi:hypothetical protein